MHLFHYQDNQLYCEQAKVDEIAQDVDTPFYLYSQGTILDHYKKLDTALADIWHLICYSLKSNSNMAVCKTLAKQGSGADVVSGGELFRALRAGISAEKIVFAGVGKTDSEISYALKSDIFIFNVESMSEAHAINRIAGKLGKKAKIALRINPDVDADTHKHITTGKKENKFGLAIDNALDYYKEAGSLPNLIVSGVHAHIGSQIVTTDPYVKSIGKLTNLVYKLRDAGIEIETLNIGGGLGIIYKEETPSTARDFANAVLPLIKPTGCKLIMEPGRFIIGNAGIMVTKVVYIKKTDAKTFVIVDAGMNDLIRPALYNSYHAISPVNIESSEEMVVDVVGPICESADCFAKERSISKVNEGDLLAIFSAGAYGFVMSSNYNSRPRIPEVMVKDDKHYIVRQRETYEDLITGESVPEDIV
ncbi:diaminopimelate decarboxylase [Candidatus Poribacteria bacterium]|nr:diaminopimelate decarboxylase [Candidatus Poribacteria bacterium]